MKMYKKYFLILIITLFLIPSIYSQTEGENPFLWQQPGGGINGDVNAITIYDSNIIVAGIFNLAGNTNVSNIAQWDGNQWTSLGAGLDDTVYALTVYNGELIAGGNFTNFIAKWDGSQWQTLGSGFNGEVNALIVHNNILYAGGDFGSPYNNIAQWNGTSWQSVGSGLNDQVHAFTIFEGKLIAGGRFDNSNLNGIASWNGSVWEGFGNGFDDRVFALTVYNNELIVGGRFENPGYPYLARWTGNNWVGIGGGLEDRVYALTVFNGELIAGGQFKFAGAGNLMVNRIASFNGSEWKTLSTGMNSKVNTLYVRDSTLIAGGEFTIAGGLINRHISFWERKNTFSVSGNIRYSDTQGNVSIGKVKALRIDLYTRQVIVADSAIIQANGNYTLTKVPANTDALIITIPDDDLDFIPTYYPETIQWENATMINLSTNANDVDISVSRIQNNLNPGSIGGRAFLNFLPAGFLTGSGLPFKSDAIIYFKIGNEYKSFGASNNFENYVAASLPEGNYDILVNRIGYETVTGNATLNYSTGFHLDSVNFILDTAKIVNIKNNNEIIADNFYLFQNYPNPFNPVTNISYQIDLNSEVTLKIYDVLGKEIATLVNQKQTAGRYLVEWSSNGQSSGIYFYRINVKNSNGEFILTKKMILTK